MAQIVPLDILFERFPAPQKRYSEIVVFVHHYGGNKHSFRRHIDWFNLIGFDCISFDLPAQSFRSLTRVPLNKNWNFGLRHIWADHIERVLGHIVGPKILVTFSMPSMSALMAIVARQTMDVKAWVCDGGPFIDIHRGIENLISTTNFFGIATQALQKPFMKRTLTRLLGTFWGGRNFNKDAKKLLCRLPKDFPILSIRYAKDTLVPLQCIENFFMPALNQIHLEVLLLDKPDHLLGFKEEPELYQITVQKFLNAHATTISPAPTKEQNQ